MGVPREHLSKLETGFGLGEEGRACHMYYQTSISASRYSAFVYSDDKMKQALCSTSIHRVEATTSSHAILTILIPY